MKYVLLILAIAWTADALLLHDHADADAWSIGAIFFVGWLVLDRLPADTSEREKNHG